MTRRSCRGDIGREVIAGDLRRISQFGIGRRRVNFGDNGLVPQEVARKGGGRDQDGSRSKRPDGGTECRDDFWCGSDAFLGDKPSRIRLAAVLKRRTGLRLKCRQPFRRKLC